MSAQAELVLEQLRESAGREVRADDLGDKLGLSPAALFAAIESLRAQGWDIAHVDRRGHKGFLLHEPTTPLPARIGSLSHARIVGRPLVFREEVDSTSTLALELAEQGAEHGTAVLAQRQTAGRGRRGRSWVNLPGEHVFLSIVLRPNLPAERVFELTLVAAVALAEALEACGVAPQIKWPNDLEVNDRKLAGILSELGVDPQGRVQHVVLGIGVNVDTPPGSYPEEIRGRATSAQAEASRPLSSAELVAALFEKLEEWLVLHESMGFGTVLDSWRARASTLGAEVRALVDGQVIAGVAEDVDDTGALLVRDAEERLHRIVAGEVTTLRRATQA